MNKYRKFEYFVDNQLLNLINIMEGDVKRRLYLGEKADALHYVVIELFLRAGFAKQYYQPNGHPGWVLSDLGQAELDALIAQKKDAATIGDDDEINTKDWYVLGESKTKEETVTQ